MSMSSSFYDDMDDNGEIKKKETFNGKFFSSRIGISEEKGRKFLKHQSFHLTH